ncbi:conserved hypothetical protein [Micromonospora sp. ATCC 39149]|nr:conserved hypothetical protein [Micromonospora sp. ATCC 39149]
MVGDDLGHVAAPQHVRAGCPEPATDYYSASEDGKQRLRDQLCPTNYSSADRDVIDALYLRMYEDELDERRRMTLLGNRLITAARHDAGGVTLDLTERITGEREQLTADRRILATGYRDLGTKGRTEQLPPTPCAPVRDLLGDTGIDTAYEVQSRAARLLPCCHSGRRAVVVSG